MNYERPELLDKLAAEYVLGTLDGAARRRFDRLLLESAAARAAVEEWQTRLGAMAQQFPEVTPRRALWQRIEDSIEPVTEMPSMGGLGFWRRWALVSSVAFVAAVIFIFKELPTEETLVPPQSVAFVNEENLTPLWVVSMNFDTGELTTQAVSATAQDIDRVYELWMLPAQGNPQSLGLMPVNGDTTRRNFSPALLDLLRGAQGLAVSIEPPGGSPTGLPTGPVVYQAEMVDI